MPSTSGPTHGTARAQPWGGSVRERTAWLLRVNRLHAADGYWARASRFTAAFHGGAWSRPISESTVSRWETGQLRVPHGAVRRYEELLELPPGTLVAVIDTANRYAAGEAMATSPLSRETPDAATAEGRLDVLVDRACGDSPMSGAEWDELTTVLAAIPEMRLVPSRSWGVLAERLLSEMVIADSVAWMQRFEALNRLLNHPIGQVHAIDACAALAADHRSRVVVEVISALDSTAHPDATRHVLRELRHPTSGAVQYGALLACVRKTRNRHLTPDQLADLASVLAELLAEPRPPAAVRPVAVDILTQLQQGRGLAEPVRARLATLAADPTLTSVIDEHCLVPTRIARPTGRRLANEVIAAMPQPGDQAAEPLPALIEELLFDPQPDVRLFTAMLLGATPYRGPLATCVADWLTRTPAVLANPDQSVAAFGALRVLGGQAQRRLLERLVVDPKLPGHVVLQAAHALGHVDGHSPDDYWLTALDHHARAWRRTTPSALSVLDQLVYALGIARHDRLLRRLERDAAAPAQARSAAAWWLAIPEVISISALT